MINLARALYRNTSSVLIENVLSRLDEYWRKIVIKSVILQEYSHKTWLIATHNIDLLSKADKIIFIKDKKIDEIQNLEKIKAKPCFNDLKQLIVEENKHLSMSVMSESE
jgi:ATP-binding cassette, subfamily C (CFTR/MRP), member 1